MTRSERTVQSSRARNRRTLPPEPRVPFRTRARALLRRALGRLAAQRRLFSLLGTLAIAAAVIGVVRFSSRALEQFLRTAPTFATQHVEVQGNQRLSKDEVIEAAGLALGKNVFEVSPEAATQRLLRAPWIESAHVRRRLPGSYEIVVRERRAVALLSLQELYLVSDDGIAFKVLAAGDPYDLPIISGLDALVPHDKRALASALTTAVALLHDYQDAGLTRRAVISELRIDDDGALSLVVGADAMLVTLGKAPFRQKLERLRGVLGLLSSQKAQAAYVYLDNQRHPERVTARLR